MHRVRSEWIEFLIVNDETGRLRRGGPDLQDPRDIVSPSRAKSHQQLDPDFFWQADHKLFFFISIVDGHIDRGPETNITSLSLSEFPIDVDTLSLARAEPD
jgi:hypothetical protein